MKSNLKRLAFLIVLSCISLPVYSQPDESNAQRKSDQSKDASVHNASIRNAKNEDDTKEVRDGEYWFSRGYALHQADHYIEAIEAFTRSISLRHRQATCMYNVACGYSLLNDKDNALFWLERSLAVGFDRPDLLRDDSDLDPLRSDPRFKAILQKVSFTKKSDNHAKDKTVSRLEEAISNFEQLRRESSQDGYEWYRVGSRLLRLRDFDRAAAALAQAVEHLGYRGASAMYNLACTYSLKGDRALGLEWLEKSINAGFDEVDKLTHDPDIASLRGEARFKNIQELSGLLTLSQFSGQESERSQYSKQRWAPAVHKYESFLRNEPNNGRGWFNLGYALHFSSEHTKAIEAFERAIQFGYRPPTSMYNIACAHAMMNHRDAAFDWLDKAVKADFDIGGYIHGDEDLNNLRSDPRFKRFLELAADEHKAGHKSEK
ncbi:MAG: tetratricopeptide repeat protein [Acidobacteriota bacterium]